jgi:hypothetical protein
MKRLEAGFILVRGTEPVIWNRFSLPIEQGIKLKVLICAQRLEIEANIPKASHEQTLTS